MMPLRPLSTLAAALAALAALPAAACSVAPGYRPPSNLELVAGADAIVLGQVVGGTPAEQAANGVEPFISVRPVVALKGLLPGQDIPLAGMALGAVAPSDPLELERPHPDALAGACIRHTFAPGAHVLFFLDRVEGTWVPAGGPFTRWAEDVAGSDAPWLELVLFYARIAPLDPDQRIALIEAEREALRARADEPAALAIADDLDRTLAAPPPSTAAQAQLADDPAEAENAVDAALRRMRQAAIEAGN